MSILFCDNLNLEQDNPMSTLYLQKVNKIIESKRCDFYNIHENIINIKQYKTLLLGCRSIFMYKVFKGAYKKELEEKFNKLMEIPNKYFWIQDMHPKTYGDLHKLCELLDKHKINIIFTFYNNTEGRVMRKNTPNVKHYFLPHHINTNIFKTTNIKKEHDILLYGSIHQTHYPFRFRLFNLINNNTDKFKVKFVEKPEGFNPELCEYGLSELINKSKICIATKSKYDYFVAKYHEISACSALVAGNMATDGKNVYNDNYLELNEKDTDEQIINKLKDALNNYDNYKDKIKKMNEIIINEYNLDKYLSKLFAIILQ